MFSDLFKNPGNCFRSFAAIEQKKGMNNSKIIVTNRKNPITGLEYGSAAANKE